jgi:hypothetical protein
VLDAPKGSSVQTFTLTLKEADDTGAQQNSASAAIVACPITDFFAGDENGKLSDAPAADCDVATAKGARNDDGTWTFDLAAIANAWLDPFGTVAANGLRFDPGPGTFQVSLTGKEDATFDVALTPPQDDADPFDSSTTTTPGGFTGSSSGPDAGGITVAPPPAVDVPTTVKGDDTRGTGAPTTTAVASGASAGPSRAGETGGNLPGALLLLVLLALGGAALVALALGPAGRQRTASSRRAGGVTRALDSHATSNPGAGQ